MHLVRSSGNKMALVSIFFILFILALPVMISWYRNKNSKKENKRKILEDCPRSEKIEGHVIKEIETISSSYVPIKMAPIRKYQSVAKYLYQGYRKDFLSKYINKMKNSHNNNNINCNCCCNTHRVAKRILLNTY